MSKVCWGKIIAGAAIAAGAVAAIALFPEQADKVGSAVKEGLAYAYNAIGDAGKWVLEKVAQFANLLTEHKEIAIGSAAVAGGLMGAAHMGRKHHEEAALSFAEREDARNMQALLVARMQAQGYEPAMAMNAKGR